MIHFPTHGALCASVTTRHSYTLYEPGPGVALIPGPRLPSFPLGLVFLRSLQRELVPNVTDVELRFFEMSCGTRAA
jgi:hypothetical protein